MARSPVLEDEECREKSERLFEQRPELRRAIMKHKGSRLFHCYGLLAYDDELEDGFMIHFSREVLRVDAMRDPDLRSFLDGLQCRVPVEASPHNRVLALLSAVAQAFGGADGGTESRWKEFSEAVILDATEPCNIGILLGNSAGPGTGLRRHRAVLLKYALDALQVCPSTLFDYRAVALVAGDVGLRIRGVHPDHLWNVVWFDGQRFLCDA